MHRLFRAIKPVVGTARVSTLASSLPTVSAVRVAAAAPSSLSSSVLGSGLRTFATAAGARRRSASKNRAASPRRAASKSRAASKPRATRARSASRSASKGRRARSLTPAQRKKNIAAEKKAAKKEAKRERALEKKEEEKERRAMRRDSQRERRELKKQELKEHKRDVRERARERHNIAVVNAAEKKMFQKLRQKSIKAGDPNAPSRAKSAYVFFFQERQPIVASQITETGKAKIAAIGKAIGAEWKALSAEAKKPFEEKAAADKERSAKERAEYDSSAPKKPLTPYLRWAQGARDALVNSRPELKKDIAAVAKELGAQWKALSESEKAPFVAEYETESKAFKAAKEEFIAKQIEQFPPELRAMMAVQIPKSVHEVRPWIAKVKQVLAAEEAAEKNATATATASN